MKKEKLPKHTIPTPIRFQEDYINKDILFCVSSILKSQLSYHLENRKYIPKVLIHLDFLDCEELIRLLDRELGDDS